MKKQKMLITLAGLVAVVVTSATITAFTLAGDGSGTPAEESPRTHEPAFQDDKMPTDFGSRLARFLASRPKAQGN